MNTISIFTFFVLFSGAVQALGDFKGFVPVRENLQLYAEYSAPSSGKATVILLNGLTYSTRQWVNMSAAFKASGIGVLRFDMDGMGETLLHYAPAVKPFPYQQQVQDLKNLLLGLKLHPPYHFVGLSYGGAIGVAYGLAYPQEIGNLVLIAPYTRPLDNQDLWIKNQIVWNRIQFPANRATDDELYDFFLRTFIYTVYPGSEPTVVENPFKLEATFRLVQGIRKFKPEDFASELKMKIHLITAERDQYLSSDVLEAFWSKIPKSSRLSRMMVMKSEHKIPEVFPKFLAAWVVEVIRANPILLQGLDFIGYPNLGIAKSGDREIPLSKER